MKVYICVRWIVEAALLGASPEAKIHEVRVPSLPAVPLKYLCSEVLAGKRLLEGMKNEQNLGLKWNGKDFK